MNNASHPIGHLQAAEQKLAESILRAADALDSVGTNLDAALARYRQAAAAATARLGRASEVVREIASGILCSASNAADEIDDALASLDVPMPPCEDAQTPPEGCEPEQQEQEVEQDAAPLFGHHEQHDPEPSAERSRPLRLVGVFGDGSEEMPKPVPAMTHEPGRNGKCRPGRRGR